MATKNFQLYLFETIERLARFFIHLNYLDAQFYSNEKKILLDKKDFISSYETCLERLIETCIVVNTANKKFGDDRINIIQLENINVMIKSLQSKLLIYLPRPTEPVELRRFCRVIQKQIIKLDKRSSDKISIYVNENTEDNIYASDPLNNFKFETINPLIEYINDYTKKVELGKDSKITGFRKSLKEGSTTIHISVPRIEASNPCHWPTLIHEVAHSLMKEKWFNKIGIYKDFVTFLSEKVVDPNLIKEILAVIDLESWLIECWCDLFACALIGPSFYFSQYSTFIHAVEFNDNKKYPPQLFRLKIISSFISHRFPTFVTDDNFNNLVSECDELLSSVDKKNNWFSFDDIELISLFSLFKEYFINEFFILENGLLNFKDIDLKDLFEKISPFVNMFDLAKIKDLSESLNNGFPIPSYRKPVKNNSLFESANHIQEILLAAWIYRNGQFETKMLKAFDEINFEQRPNQLLNNFKDNIVKDFLRFDEAILSSIQISEWVDLLIENEVTNEDLDVIFKKSGKAKDIPKLLVDKDIFNELKENHIKVIPLISLKEQLGSTSLDIRLGTSFEIFYPNQFGIVDFTEDTSHHNLKFNSKKINLDYLDSIPINPGQFMLGHSMEYFDLPNNISAGLEGRSSFARLGIEIHMTAGFVEPGFQGVLTFEIFNAGTNPVMLYPGFRIGQLRFERINQPSITYKKGKTKYSGSLEHRFSMQRHDYEINKIINEKNRAQKK